MKWNEWVSVDMGGDIIYEWDPCNVFLLKVQSQIKQANKFRIYSEFTK